MNRGKLVDIIASALPQDPEASVRGFWFNGEGIICSNENTCERVADFLEGVLGGPILTDNYNELSGVEGLGYYITID